MKFSVGQERNVTVSSICWVKILLIGFHPASIIKWPSVIKLKVLIEQLNLLHLISLVGCLWRMSAMCPPITKLMAVEWEKEWENRAHRSFWFEVWIVEFYLELESEKWVSLTPGDRSGWAVSGEEVQFVKWAVLRAVWWGQVSWLHHQYCNRNSPRQPAKYLRENKLFQNIPIMQWGRVESFTLYLVDQNLSPAWQINF